jgi:hypothetical protein
MDSRLRGNEKIGKDQNDICGGMKAYVTPAEAGVQEPIFGIITYLR